MKFSAYNIEIGSSRQKVLLAAATVTVAASAAAFLRTSAFGPKTEACATTRLWSAPELGHARLIARPEASLSGHATVGAHHIAALRRALGHPAAVQRE